MHASHIKKIIDLILNSFFEITKSAILIIMKIHICFCDKKKNSRFVFNENIDLFWIRKIFKFVFSENTDLFCIFKKMFW